MVRRYCPHCGLALGAGDPADCPRCGAGLDAGGLAIFDPSSGEPFAGTPIGLHCWHCDAPIGRADGVCKTCGTLLTDRRSAAIRFDVVPRATRDRYAVGAIAGRIRPVPKEAAAPIRDTPPVPTSVPRIRPPPPPPPEPAPAYCWHCGLPLFEEHERCPRCDVRLEVPDTASANFSPLTGIPRLTEATADPGTAPGTAPPIEPETPPEPAPTLATRGGRNLIARHWRGELPLGVSVWVFGVLINIALYFAAPFVIDTLPPPTTPLVVFLWTVVAWVAITAVSIWQAVGIARSASRRRRERWQRGLGAGWAIAARVWAGLIVLEIIVAIIVEGSWQGWTAVEIAFLGDPDIPPATVSIDAENRAIIIEGGIKFGLAEALETALAEAPETEVLVLASPGGRVGAAGAAMDVIRAHGLSTYTNADCASACTLLFAAGRERVIGPDGRLGYHAASSGYRFDPQIADDPYYERLLRDAGIDADFVERATASIRFTVPDVEDLFRIGAITAEEQRPRLYLGTLWRRL
ncbi:MAG: hypothetical protein AB7U48_12145 [Bauldia sp.]